MSDCESNVDFAKIRRLSEIRREIDARIAKLDKLGAKAVDMVDSIDCLLKEAEGLCDAERLFTAFKNSLAVGRSRVYELLAIRDGRKTLDEIRAATRARVAKHRASKHVTDSASVTSSALPDKVKVNDQSVRTADFSAAAQEQIAKAVKKQADDVIDKLPASWDAAEETPLQPSDDANAAAEQQEFWQQSLANMAGESISLPAYWGRQFGKWEDFEVPSDLIILAKQAAETWTALARRLEDKAPSNAEAA